MAYLISWTDYFTNIRIPSQAQLLLTAKRSKSSTQAAGAIWYVAFGVMQANLIPNGICWLCSYLRSHKAAWGYICRDVQAVPHDWGPCRTANRSVLQLYTCNQQTEKQGATQRLSISSVKPARGHLYPVIHCTTGQCMQKPVKSTDAIRNRYTDELSLYLSLRFQTTDVRYQTAGIRC